LFDDAVVMMWFVPIQEGPPPRLLGLEAMPSLSPPL
jgi:hypothetical protein